MTNPPDVHLHARPDASPASGGDYAALVRAASGGDRAAMEALLMRAQEVAYRFSVHVCGHVDEAEDVMQEALLKPYRHAQRIREPGAFRPWLYRTVRNACLMRRRRRVDEPARLQSLDELLPTPDGMMALDPPDPVAVERDLRPERLRRAAGSGRAGLDARRERDPAALRVVPDEPEEAVLARGERDDRARQPFLGQVEERPLLREEGPTRAIAAPFEPESLQEGRRDPAHAEAVDAPERSEVGLEPARRLRRGDRQERGGEPLRLGAPGGDEEVRHLPSRRVVEAEVGQETASGAGLGAGQERDVHVEPVRAGCAGKDGSLVTEGRDGADSLLAGHRQCCGEEAEGEEPADRRHSFSRGRRTNFWMAIATSESEIASPTNEATR